MLQLLQNGHNNNCKTAKFCWQRTTFHCTWIPFGHCCMLTQKFWWFQRLSIRRYRLLVRGLLCPVDGSMKNGLPTPRHPGRMRTHEWTRWPYSSSYRWSNSWTQMHIYIWSLIEPSLPWTTLSTAPLICRSACEWAGALRLAFVWRSRNFEIMIA